MTAEQLRNSILQEAISGRLVPQDPNDEPASALLARIREEKARLVKESKLKKKDLAESPIAEDETPFEIPSSWRWIRLKNIVSILGDGIHGTPEYDINGEYYFVNGNNLSHNRIIIKGDTKRVNEIEFQKYRKILDETTILVSINGTIGNVGHYNGEPVILGKSACYYNLMDVALKPYITTLMYTDYFLKYAKGNATGSTIKNVSLAVMNDFMVPLPPLAEQKRIVAKLEELLPIVEQYGKAQKELDELNAALPARLRQSILQEAVQGKLTSHDEKDDWAHNFKKQLPPLKIKSNPEWPTEFPFDLPESWEWCRVGDICDILNGYAFKSDKYVESGINVIRISNVQDGKIIDKDNKYISLSMEKEIEDYMLREKDLLMSLTGNVGRVGLLPKSMLPAALNQRVACLRLKDESIKPFLLWYLQSPVFRERCESSGHGMAQLNISTEWLKQEYFPLPPLAEQQRIVAKIEELLADINKISK